MDRGNVDAIIERSIVHYVFNDRLGLWHVAWPADLRYNTNSLHSNATTHSTVVHRVRKIMRPVGFLE